MMSKVLEALKDRKKAKLLFSKHKTSLKAWAALSVAIVLVFFVFSDGDFSFLLTLGSIVGMFSFGMVLYTIETTKSAKGISLVMIECYVVLLGARLFSIIPFEGYLPYDKSGDWLYQTVEAISFMVAGTIVYMCRVRYADSYAAGSDTLRHYYLILPALVVSCIFHPSLNAFMPADIAWTFALFLESISCLPQLFMFHKEGKVEAFTTHFLAGQALSKLVSFIFWIASYSELNDHTRPFKSYVGIWVMGMQFIQLLVMGDFIWHYLRCLSRGVPVEFILAENV